jgi:hypothetical protein
MRSRRRRANTGEAPPVPIATTTSPRSTIAGKMKLDSSGRSTTLTGTLPARASAATASSRPVPVAATTRRNSRKFACRGSPSESSSRPGGLEASSISSATSTSSEYQRTSAPAARNRRSLFRAAGPEPISATFPALRSRNSGKKRIGANSSLTRR